MSSWSKYANWLVPIVLMFGMAIGLGFNGTYGQDSHEYLRFAEEWKASGLSFSVASDFHWPVGFPLAGILLSYLGFSVLWALNLVSLLAVLGTLFFLRKTINELYRKDANLWILLAAVTQVYFVRGGILVMSDMLCAFGITASYYYAINTRKEKNFLSFVFLLLAATLAFFSRHASIPLLIPPIVYGIYYVGSKHRLIRTSLFLGLLITVVLIIGVNSSLLNRSSSLFHEWSFSNFFSTKVITPDGEFQKTVPNAMYIFGNFLHIGYLSIGLVLLPFYRYSREAFRTWIIPLGLILYFTLLIGLDTQNYRFLILSHPLVLMLLFGAFNQLEQRLSKRKLLSVFVVCILVFNGAFFVYSFRKTFAVHNAEKEVSISLKMLNHKGTVYGFYVDQSFRTYGIDNEIRSLYAEEYKKFTSGDLVVYNPTMLTPQWKGTTVGNNWDFLLKNYTLDTLQYLNNGWRIYEVK